MLLLLSVVLIIMKLLLPVSKIGEIYIPVHGLRTGEKKGSAGDGGSTASQESSVSSHQRKSSAAHSLRAFSGCIEVGLSFLHF